MVPLAQEERFSARVKGREITGKGVGEGSVMPMFTKE